MSSNDNNSLSDKDDDNKLAVATDAEGNKSDKDQGVQRL
jgi:hypothetical protein